MLFSTCCFGSGLNFSRSASANDPSNAWSGFWMSFFLYPYCSGPVKAECLLLLSGRRLSRWASHFRPGII